MFGKKTNVSVKDGRMTIMTDDARNPGVTSLMIDQVRSGSFETAPSENEGYALVFKPQGRKTTDTIAIYNTQKQAAAAMKSVFKGLSGKSKSSGFMGGFVKTALIIIAVLLLLYVIGAWIMSALMGSVTSDMLNDTAAPAVSEDTSLPVGEAFPADRFIQATQDAQ